MGTWRDPVGKRDTRPPPCIPPDAYRGEDQSRVEMLCCCLLAGSACFSRLHAPSANFFFVLHGLALCDCGYQGPKATPPQSTRNKLVDASCRRKDNPAALPFAGRRGRQAPAGGPVAIHRIRRGARGKSSVCPRTRTGCWAYARRTTRAAMWCAIALILNPNH